MNDVRTNSRNLIISANESEGRLVQIPTKVRSTASSIAVSIDTLCPQKVMSKWVTCCQARGRGSAHLWCRPACPAVYLPFYTSGEDSCAASHVCRMAYVREPRPWKHGRKPAIGQTLPLLRQEDRMNSSGYSFVTEQSGDAKFSQLTSCENCENRHKLRVCEITLVTDDVL